MYPVRKLAITLSGDMQTMSGILTVLDFLPGGTPSLTRKLASAVLFMLMSRPPRCVPCFASVSKSWWESLLKRSRILGSLLKRTTLPMARMVPSERMRPRNSASSALISVGILIVFPCLSASALLIGISWLDKRDS